MNREPLQYGGVQLRNLVGVRISMLNHLSCAIFREYFAFGLTTFGQALNSLKSTHRFRITHNLMANWLAY